MGTGVHGVVVVRAVRVSAGWPVTEIPPDGVSAVWSGRAAVFHAEHPSVYEQLVRYAREARSMGVERLGIELLWNRMRWDNQGGALKLNQNFKAWYARRIMEREHDLTDVFEIRRRV